MAFQAVVGAGLVLCGAMLYGFDATLATGTTFLCTRRRTREDFVTDAAWASIWRFSLLV